jgi:sucrose-6-phosphate hydrolase SacC (GH32 family)
MEPRQPTIYRIEVCYTDDMTHWSFLGTVEAYTTSSKTGIWEPYLFQIPNNPNLYCAYAKELINGEQNIVARESTDGGVTWGSEFIISHTPGSRDGMPTITTLPDRSLLAIFEGFWAGTWGKFTVNSRRSFDGGRTWVQPQKVHESSASFNSGAPWATRLADGTIVVVFMTDENWNGPLSWPNHASIKLLVGDVSAGGVSWADLQTIAGPSSFWPSAYYWAENSLLMVAYNGVYRTSKM